MSRYAWLREEIELIPRRKFFVLERQPTNALEPVESEYGPLPHDYREFVRDFGAASLYRCSHSFGYYLHVIAPPELQTQSSGPAQAADKGAIVVRIGFFINSGYAWLERTSERRLQDSPVYVDGSWKPRKVADSFEGWLKRSFSACRSFYTKQEWNEILTAAPPFDARERAILDAIPKFEFRKVAITKGGNLLIEITNRSSLELPYLTVGARVKAGMSGAVALVVSGIAPGTTRTIEADIYKGSMDPSRVELFSLPLPDPEDAAYFRELRKGNQDRASTHRE